MDDSRPGLSIWLNPGVVPPPTQADPIKRDWYTLIICFGIATPTCMGDHDLLGATEAVVEEDLKWQLMR